MAKTEKTHVAAYNKTKSKLKTKKWKKSLPIIVFGPSASGTSLLSHTCRLCGMFTGMGEDDTHHERQDISEMLNRGELGYVEGAINSFAGKAEMDGHFIFGMKLTCFGIGKWKLLKPYFDKHWPGAIKFTPFRHPYGYYMSQCAKKPDRSPDPDLDHIITNWLGFYDTWKYLVKDGFKLIEFPYAWDSGDIKYVIIESGMKWNEDVFSWYEAENANHISERQIKIFSERFKEATTKYNSLVEMVK